MSYHASDFLAGLFGDGPAVAPLASATAAPGEPLPTTVDSAMTTTTGESMATTVSETDFSATDGTLAASRFAGWVRRPDVTGKWGWEAPNVPEWRRWWAGPTFEELPEARPPCLSCGGILWWEDLEGGRHCLDCDRAKFEQGRELLRVAQRLRPASGLSSPQRAEVEAKPPTPGELRCDRCKSTQVVEATTHGDRTVRLDCARCGRFVAWKVWYGKLLVENGN